MEKLILKDITTYLEILAPLSFQESYDNSGLITGNHQMEVKGALLCLDSIEATIDEAISKHLNLVIAHHPIIFNGIKKLNGKNYIERTIIKAIKNDIAIYAIHTNLDNIHLGVNAKIADKLGLINQKILDPKTKILGKLVTYVPDKKAEELRKVLFASGAGKIGNYDACSFNISGRGTFRGNEKSNPYAGEKGKLHIEEETRIEVVYEKHNEGKIIAALKTNHPYEEVAYDCYDLQNAHQEVGSGMIGNLEEPMNEIDFLIRLKKVMQTGCIKHTGLLDKKIARVAVCGGSGSFLLSSAIAQEADILVTADFKYHQFFDAEQKIIIADIGHYESEQFTKELIYDFLIKKFPTFALHLSEINTNPVKYF